MTLIHFLSALLVMVLFGGNFAVAKMGLEELPALSIMVVRFVLVAALLIPFVPIPRGRLVPIFFYAFSMGGVHFPLMFTGLAHVDAGTAAIAIQLQVPFSAVLAHFLYEDKLGWRRLLGMALAIGGVMVVAGEPRLEGSLFYLGLIIVASLVWAISNIQLKRLEGVSAHAVNGWMALFAIPQLILTSYLLEDGHVEAFLDIGTAGVTAILYMAIGVTIIAYGIWIPLVQRYPVNQTIPFTLLVPAIGVLGGVMLLGEPLTWSVVIGGLLTTAGVGVIVIRRPRSVDQRTAAGT